MDYLDRYRRDERDAVWGELTALGQLEAGTTLWASTYAVACETMTRARSNVERIVAWLDRLGYRSMYFDRIVDAHVPPDPEIIEQLRELDARVGPIPLSLRAWWEIVGSVDLRGTLPAWPTEWPFEYSDPLYVDPVSYVLHELEEWETSMAHPDAAPRREPFTPSISPDVFHKADVSGGAPYSIVLPNGAVDVPLLDVMVLVPDSIHGGFTGRPVSETFLEYLRRSFRYGGFAGFAYSMTQAHPTLSGLIGELLPL